MIDTHMQLLMSENHISDADRDWFKWFETVDVALASRGIDMDGDHDINGYSIDDAYDQFVDGNSAPDYITSVLELPQPPRFLRPQ